AQERAEARPQWFGIAHFPQLGSDRRRAPRRLVTCQLVVGGAGLKRGGDLLGRQDARQHRVVAPLDARHVHEPCRAAQKRPAGESELGHRLPAPLAYGARTIGELLPSLEGAAHQRMRFEALEFLERREVWIFVVQMQHEAGSHEGGVELIEERTAAGSAVEWPAECVLYQPRLMFLRRDLPQLL